MKSSCMGPLWDVPASEFLMSAFLWGIMAVFLILLWQITCIDVSD